MALNVFFLNRYHVLKEIKAIVFHTERCSKYNRKYYEIYQWCNFSRKKTHLCRLMLIWLNNIIAAKVTRLLSSGVLVGKFAILLHLTDFIIISLVFKVRAIRKLTSVTVAKYLIWMLSKNITRQDRWKILQNLVI